MGGGNGEGGGGGTRRDISSIASRATNIIPAVVANPTNAVTTAPIIPNLIGGTPFFFFLTSPTTAPVFDMFVNVFVARSGDADACWMLAL